MAELASARNNALPYPVYGVAFVVTFPLLDADGDPISPSSPDSEVSKNCDTFADCTNEAVEIATSTGTCYLILTATEMTADIVTVRIQSTGAKTTILTLYPRKLPILTTGTCQGSNDTGDIQLASGDSAVDDTYNGCLCVAVIDSTTEARLINDYVGSTKVGEVSPAWSTAQPDSNDTYTIYLPEGRQVQSSNALAWNSLPTVALPLVPATAGRSLVVDAAGLADANVVKVGPTGSGTAQTAGDLKSLIDAVDNFVDTEIADIQARLPAALGANGNIKADVRDFSGTAGTFSSGRPEVNATHIAGTIYGSSTLFTLASHDPGETIMGATDLGTGTGFTAIPWNASWDAEVQSEVQDAIEANHLDHLIAVADPGSIVANSSFLAKLVSKSATPAFSSYDNTTDSLEANRDNIGTAGAALTAADDAVISALSTLSSAVDAVDNFVDTEIADIQSRLPAALVSGRMDSSVGAMAANVMTAAAAAPDLTTELQSGLATSSALSTAQTDITSILADTNELQTDWANGGRLDLLIDAILADTDSLDTTKITTARAAVLTDWIDGGRLDLILDARASQASVDTIDDFLDTEVAAILAAVDTEIATIVTAVGTTIPATLSGLFTSALTESYRSAGAAGSVSQYLHEMIAHLGESSIASTTKTLKKLDGSTTAKTYTLNDASTPTAITETT